MLSLICHWTRCQHTAMDKAHSKLSGLKCMCVCIFVCVCAQVDEVCGRDRSRLPWILSLVLKAGKRIRAVSLCYKCTQVQFEGTG